MFGDNQVVPTPPTGDNSNRTADTAFVNVAIASAIASAIGSLPIIPSTTQIDFLAGGISFPAVQDYRIVEYAPFTTTLTALYAKLSTGQLTAIIGINSSASPVTGGIISIGTSQVSSLLSAANVMTVGNTLILTIASTSGVPSNLSFTVVYNRPLQ